MHSAGTAIMQPAMPAVRAGGNVQTAYRDACMINVPECQPFQIDDSVDATFEGLIGGFHATQIAQTFFTAGSDEPDVALRGNILLPNCCQQAEQPTQTKAVVAQTRPVDQIPFAAQRQVGLGSKYRVRMGCDH